MRKNPDNKPLRIKRDGVFSAYDERYALILSNLAIAESNLVRAGKDSAMPHFIAIVKEIERVLKIEFKIIEESE